MHVELAADIIIMEYKTRIKANFFFIYILLFFLQEEERGIELETSMREKHQSAASCTPPTGDVPATKVHALDQNRTRTFQSAGRCSIH